MGESHQTTTANRVVRFFQINPTKTLKYRFRSFPRPIFPELAELKLFPCLEALNFSINL